MQNKQQNNKETIEEISYKFQNKILEAFNGEKKIPFLLKYFLLKEIWESVESTKVQVETRVMNSLPPVVQTVEIKGEEEEEKE